MKHRFLSTMSSDPRFDTIKRERVSDRIAQNLLKLIASGELAPGERLPGERQLADMMGVSRVSVRAALQDAASVSGLLITTEAMVAEKPEKKSAAPAAPDMGGMDF